MIKIENSTNKTEYQIIYNNYEEMSKLFDYFNIKDPSKDWTYEVQSGLSEGKRALISLQGLFLKGLKLKVIQYLERNNIEYQDNTIEEYPDISEKELDEFISRLDLPFKPYNFQIKGFKLAVRKQNHILLSATGSGKSLILYMIIRWYILQHKKILLVVPDVGLVNQMYSDLKEYTYLQENKLFKELESSWSHIDKQKIQKKIKNIKLNRKFTNCDYDFDILYCKIFSGQEKYTNHKVKISTWQSIYDKGPTGFFDDIDVLLFDECHLSKSDSYYDINKYTDVNIKLGMTGTLPPNILEQLLLEGLIGQATRIVSPQKLIEMGLATKTVIQPIYLKYPKTIIKKIRSHRSNPDAKKKPMNFLQENTFFRECEEKIDFIVRLGKKLKEKKKGNTIILTKNIDIGKKIFNKLKDSNSNNENIFYIAGGVKSVEREMIRKGLDKIDDAMIVGSLAIMSTGINIKSLTNIIFAQVGKSEIKTIQSLGRVMRKFEGKDVATIYDIVDDARHYSRIGTEYPNYYYKHFTERLLSYDKYDFPINKPINIKIEDYNEI